MKPLQEKLALSVGIWVFAALVFGFIRMYGVGDLMLYEQVIEFRWERFLAQMLLLGASIGIPFALLDHILSISALKRRSYWIIIGVQTSLQVILGLISLFIVVHFSQNVLRENIPIEEQPEAWRFLYSKTAMIWIGYSLIITNLIYFFRLLKDKIGAKVLLNLLLGKYHKPREEQRIFMFLDMKNSTAHAERLGHLQFTALIQDCFNDLTDALLQHHVEVYQYVGDEAILTWKPNRGFSQANCVGVYFTFAKKLQQRREYYISHYNVAPFFKAGVHVGVVAASEIGIVKREIAYLSDVLNTAARLQSMCNTYSTELLISEPVYQHLVHHAGLTFKHIGNTSLKGKKETVDIYAVHSKVG